MGTRRFLLASLVLAAPFGDAATTAAQTLTTRRIASGLNRPLWAGAPADDDRIFIVEEAGVIKILENGSINATEFLSITTQVNSFATERGLLGMVFHPDYANNGYFFLNYTDNAGDTVISRWSVSADPNIADAGSETIVLTEDQPASNHNAGALMFGADGFLYIPLGDGGGANDPGCRAQSPMQILGKMLRIEVDTLPYSVPPSNPFVGNPDFRPEIYHIGLRNPYRATVDRLTGDLFIGDVGQGAREEVNFAEAGVGGLNFGWKVMEGTRCNTSQNCAASTPACFSALFTDPIQELVHSGFSGPRAIIGGYVYRGCAIPQLDGTYFFADNSDDKIRSLRYDVQSGTVSQFSDRTIELQPPGGLTLESIASFGEDGFGELLIVEHRAAPNGEVYKIIEDGTVAAATASRNGSGVNATCFSSQSLPIFGNTFRVTVDATGHPGATFATIVGYAGPTSGLFFKGSEVLVDLTTALFFSATTSVNGGEARFAPMLPCDPTLNGISVATQAFTFGAPPLQLCNAIDLTIGGY